MKDTKPIPQLRLLPFSLSAIILLTIVSTMPNPARAQGNPFVTESEDQPSRAKKTVLGEEPPVPGNATESARLLIRSVRESKPETPIELAKALRIMLDIRQFEHAKYYLARLSAATSDDTQRSKLASSLGSDFFLNLHASNELAPEGKAFSRSVLAAAKVQSQSIEQITMLMGKLNDPNIAVRSTAFRSLRRIGPKAIATLISVFADPQREAEFPGFRGALNSMGPQAVPLLLGGSHTSDQRVRVESLRALAHYTSPEISDVLGAAILNPNLPASVRNATAVALLKRGNRQPDANTLATKLATRARELLTGKRGVTGNLNNTVTIWRWDKSKKALLPQAVTKSTAARVMAARWASDLYQFSPHQAEHRQLYLLTQLDASKRVLGSANSIKLEDFVKTYGSTTADELNRTLAAALKLNTIQAAIACCELLAETGDESCFYGSRQPCPIVQAILVGDRHLQYAALHAINSINPSHAYPGSSYAVSLAVFMANSHQQAAGLVGHHRVETAHRLAGSLLPAGLVGKAVASSRDLFAEATRDPDLALVLVSDTLDRPAFSELVRQLRSDFRTARVPIGLLIRDERNERRAHHLTTDDILTTSFSSSIDGPLLVARIDQLNGLADRDLTQVTASDRFKHANLAINWLAKVSSRNASSRFYELGRHQDQLGQLIYLPGFAQIGSQILANLGTARSQSELAEFASQDGLPDDDRQVAASALSQSISDGSTMLTNEQIERQYDRYNASEFESDTSQKVLGSILDAIEQRASDQR